MKYVLKIIPPVLFWGIFVYVILQVPYPESITQANSVQLLAFFIPFFLGVAFSLNLFLKNFFITGSLSLGLVFLLILKALDSLNIVTIVLIIISVGLFVSYFRRIKKKGLTNYSKIPKLTNMRKQ